MKAKTAFKDYYYLSKPGIIRGNLITAAAGYLFGSQLNVDWPTLIGLLSGLTFVIAGACATNNYLDRGIDAKMTRTAKRAVVAGRVSGRQAVVYAAIVTVLGLTVLTLSQNALTTGLAAFAWFAYVVLYGYAKRVTVHGTLVGCISGSIPLVAGYTAASGRFDIVAVQLSILMTAWQMAHFYGIALYRLKDYQAASIPVMPAVYGIRVTQWQVVGYIVALAACVAWMGQSGTLTPLVTIFILLLCAAWLLRAQTLLRSVSSEQWGRSVFLFSLVVMIGISLALVANPLLGQ